MPVRGDRGITNRHLIICPFVIVVLICAIGMALALFLFGVQPGVLLRDAASEFGVPLYAGAISSAGIGVLIATTAICIFATLFEVASSTELLVASGLTGLIAFDDAFLLHERVIRDRLGLLEELMPALYGFAVTYLLIRTRHAQFSTMRGYLWIGVACLAASVLLDLIQHTSAAKLVAEDMFKLFGYALMSVSFVTLAYESLASLTREQPVGENRDE